MTLLRVELRRLTSRRLVRVVALLALVGLLVVLVTAAVRSHAPGQAEHDRAAAVAAEQLKMMPDLATQRRDCLAAQEQTRLTEPAADFGCDQIHAPQASDFLDDPRLRFAEQKEAMVVGGAMALALLAFVIGTGFIGAEWHAGTLSNLLLFEPRRLRVLAAKAGGLILGVAGFGAVFMALEIGGYYTISATRGDLTGTTAGLVRSTALGGARAVLLAVAAALVGYALAGALRHTAAALGIAFGYILAGEMAIRAMWPGSESWLLSNHVLAWLQGGLDIQQAASCTGSGMMETCQDLPPIHLATDRGALYLGVVVVVTLSVLLLTFRRRDIA